MQLNVLDHSPVSSGSSAVEAFRNTVELARLAERLGYGRYWLAEHHGSGVFAGSSAEIMMARVASATSRIRVGSGGVLLSHYSPFRVAEVFHLLEGLFPGRVDLGIGRAPGGDERLARALAYSAPPGSVDFARRLDDLLAFLTGAEPVSESLRGAKAMPEVPTLPEVWSLGSGQQSAAHAAERGLAFCFAHFFTPAGGEAAARAYRESFRPSRYLERPRVGLALYVTCADTDEEAARLMRTNDIFALRVRKGQHVPLPSVEEAERYPCTPEELALIEGDRGRLTFGSPARVRAQIEQAAAAFGADEVFIATLCHSHAARLRSYELVAEAFALSPGA